MADIVYLRPAGHKKYISIAKHQLHANNTHNKWLSVQIERDLFDFADYGNYEKRPNIDIPWVCASGNLWSIQKDRSNVGVSNEQFGFFQHPVNPNDEWHGFPIIPFSQSRYTLTNDLLKRWIKQGIIGEDDVPMIFKLKRI